MQNYSNPEVGTDLYKQPGISEEQPGRLPYSLLFFPHVRTHSLGTSLEIPGLCVLKALRVSNIIILHVALWMIQATSLVINKRALFLICNWGERKTHEKCLLQITNLVFIWVLLGFLKDSTQLLWPPGNLLGTLLNLTQLNWSRIATEYRVFKTTPCILLSSIKVEMFLDHWLKVASTWKQGKKIFRGDRVQFWVKRWEESLLFHFVILGCVPPDRTWYECLLLTPCRQDSKSKEEGSAGMWESKTGKAGKRELVRETERRTGLGEDLKN